MRRVPRRSAGGHSFKVCLTGLPNKHQHGAFTLIEIIISTSLMALILAGGYVCLNAAVSSQKLLEPRLEALQNARVAMAIMSADLRHACPLSKEYDFLGMHRMLGELQADNLDFATHNYTPRRSGEGDFCQTSFFLDKDAESGQYCLWRRRNPRLAPDPLAGGSREEIARGLRGLRFEYFDGYEWYDSWGEVDGRDKARTSRRERYNLDGLPEAVRISLWLELKPPARRAERGTQPAGEPPLFFQTVVRLNLAAAVERQSTSATPTETPSENSNQPMPAFPTQ